MRNALLRAVVFLGSAAAGLLVAALLVTEMSIDWRAFLLVVVVFAVLQSVIAPLIARLTAEKASALVGAVGLISTVVALLITSALLDGLAIRGGAGPWIYASVIVWIVTMLAALLLPMVTVNRTRTSGRHPAGPATSAG